MKVPIGLLVAVARQRLKRRLQRDLGRFRVTPAQMGVLFRLREENGLSPSEIALRNMMDLPMITRVLDGMERAGLVGRKRDATDRRRVRIWLTPKGRNLAPRLRRVADSVTSELTRGFAGAEEECLRQLLHRLIRNLEEDA